MFTILRAEIYIKLSKILLSIYIFFSILFFVLPKKKKNIKKEK